MKYVLFFFKCLYCSFASAFATFLFTRVLLKAKRALMGNTSSTLLCSAATRCGGRGLCLQCRKQVAVVNGFTRTLTNVFNNLLTACSLHLPFCTRTIVTFANVPTTFTLGRIGHSGGVRGPMGRVIQVVECSLMAGGRLYCGVVCSNVVKTTALAVT